ncbi:MAG: hypothetical protein COW60_00485 [Candidatus Yonathbacteria bacterium CG17_big_fil_post_rev_8_21_14_2_50_43_9]|nr:MAG: hypothetical protein COW60_00485 [Candidatus Yonathbacteria bacterium CG17_big_fil_post_rev_8_21_14_2_50_43_9]
MGGDVNINAVEPLLYNRTRVCSINIITRASSLRTTTPALILSLQKLFAIAYNCWRDGDGEWRVLFVVIHTYSAEKFAILLGYNVECRILTN